MTILPKNVIIGSMKVTGGSQYKKYGKSHYQRNKSKYIDGAKARQKRNMAYIWEIKVKSKCVDCGISNPIVLDFDHTNGDKDKSVAYATWFGWSLEKIDKEISKCQVRCSNCHRIRHWKLKMQD